MARIEIKSQSKIFRKFIADMDNVLSKVETYDKNKNVNDCNSKEFTNSTERLSAVELNFKNSHPIKIINHWVASDFVKDEIISNIEEEKHE